MTAPDPVGLCVIDKPTGWTSHDVVARARSLFGTRKVGHAGTLDPLATGVLVLGVGRATRLLAFLGGLSKTYVATIRFGIETDSLDADGAVTVTHQMAAPDPDAVAAAAGGLTGELMQVPPMVSALKVDGRRLHQLAREGREVERAPRPVTVTRFDVTPTADPMVCEAVIDCSSGTYVRVLAADLGRRLGGGAHLRGLRRTAVGPFRISEAHLLDGVGPSDLLAPSSITRVLEPVTAGAMLLADVGHGKVLPAAAFHLATDVADRGSGPWAVLDPGGTLRAVYVNHHADTVKPAFVLT